MEKGFTREQAFIWDGPDGLLEKFAVMEMPTPPSSPKPFFRLRLWFVQPKVSREGQVVPSGDRQVVDILIHASFRNQLVEELERIALK